MSSHLTTQSTSKLTLCALCGIWTLCFHASLDAAGSICIPSDDTQSSQQTDTEPELVEGLLDLLEEQQPSPPVSEQDPLQLIQRLMEEATRALLVDATIQRASELQSDIVRSLDSLIGQLQQAQSNAQSGSDVAHGDPASNAAPRSAQQESGSEQTSALSSGESDSSIQSKPQETDAQSSLAANNSLQSQHSALNSQNSPNSAGDAPGNTSSGTAPAVPLHSPVQLQQSVWGHLPERIRSQMQSKMVEQFLPSHRRQLEAYYRALLQQEPK